MSGARPVGRVARKREWRKNPAFSFACGAWAPWSVGAHQLLPPVRRLATTPVAHDPGGAFETGRSTRAGAAWLSAIRAWIS